MLRGLFGAPDAPVAASTVAATPTEAPSSAAPPAEGRAPPQQRGATRAERRRVAGLSVCSPLAGHYMSLSHYGGACYISTTGGDREARGARIRQERAPFRQALVLAIRASFDRNERSAADRSASERSSCSSQGPQHGELFATPRIFGALESEARGKTGGERRSCRSRCHRGSNFVSGRLRLRARILLLAAFVSLVALAAGLIFRPVSEASCSGRVALRDLGRSSLIVVVVFFSPPAGRVDTQLSFCPQMLRENWRDPQSAGAAPLTGRERRRGERSLALAREMRDQPVRPLRHIRRHLL